MQCRNVSEYQNEHYGSIIEKSKLYWQKKLVDLKDYYLPVYNDNPNNDTAGANYRFALPQEIDLLFSDFAKSEGISKFTVILSVYNLLMMYFSKSDDMIIGSPLNGRERQVYKDHIGFFINLVLIRVQLYKQDNFSGFANRVHENYLEALEHQEYQINDIVNDINYTRNKYSLPITTSYITQVEHKSEYTKENVEYEFTGVDTRVDLMLNLEIFSNKTVLNFAHKKVLFDEEIFKSFTNKFIEFSKKFLTNSSNIINLN